MAEVRVWLVMRGEKHEGGGSVGIYSTRERAIAAVQEIIGGARKWEQTDAGWERGCDVIWIESWVVDDPHSPGGQDL